MQLEPKPLAWRAMADLAVWVDDRLVDSAALLSAYLHLMSRFPRTCEALGLSALYMVIHRAPPQWTPAFEGVQQRECQTPCRRCNLMLGGYSWREGSLSLRDLAPGVPTGSNWGYWKASRVDHKKNMKHKLKQHATCIEENGFRSSLMIVSSSMPNLSAFEVPSHTWDCHGEIG